MRQIKFRTDEIEPTKQKCFTLMVNDIYPQNGDIVKYDGIEYVVMQKYFDTDSVVFIVQELRIAYTGEPWFMEIPPNEDEFDNKSINI